jgi:hypothetical protein
MTVENILQLFFQAAIPIPDDIPSQRSPTQAVISAFWMVIWVILWLSATGFLFRDDNEIFINLP